MGQRHVAWPRNAFRSSEASGFCPVGRLSRASTCRNASGCIIAPMHSASAHRPVVLAGIKPSLPDPPMSDPAAVSIVRELFSSI